MRINDINFKTKDRYWKALFLYWVILLLWQNFAIYISNSLFTLIVKAGLMVYLLVVFYRKTICKKKLFVWLLFLFYSFFSFLGNERSIDSSALIYYFFPALFSLAVFVFGEKIVIDKAEYIRFLKSFIWVVFFTATYAVLFQGSYFVLLLSRSSSYGYELTSFFTSNHEYGMYITFAIAAILICHSSSRNNKERNSYNLLLLFFALNLVATLSRTSIVSCLVIVTVFVLLSERTAIKRFIIVTILLLAIVFLLSSRIQSFVSIVLLKGGNDAGRSRMWADAMDYYMNSTIIEKLFGQGYSAIGEYTRSVFLHGSVHNSFLQVLLIWGLSGFVLLLCVIGYGIKNALSVIKIEKNLGFAFLALSLSTIAFMFTNTACIMESPIDSFMLTVFTLILPKYVGNYFSHL